MVDRVEALEREVEQLDQSDFERFSLWFSEFEASVWDHKIERDFESGKLDFLIDEARAEREAGSLTDLLDGCAASRHQTFLAMLSRPP